MRFTVFIVVYLLFSYPPIIDSITLKNISLQKICDALELTDDQCCTADRALKFLGYGGLAVAVSTYGVPFVLTKLGFSATGIIGGSFAAWWQRVGIARNLYGRIQSASMTGTAARLMTTIGVSAAAFKSYFSTCDIKTSSERENCKKNQKC